MHPTMNDVTRLRALGDETNVNKGSPSKHVCSRKLWPPFGDSSRVDLVVFGRVLDVFGGGPLCHGLVMCWIVTNWGTCPGIGQMSQFCFATSLRKFCYYAVYSSV